MNDEQTPTRLELALEAVDPDYRHRFIAEIRRLCRLNKTFTVDDVVGVAGLPHKSRTNANNAVGALMRYCAEQGWIHKTGRHVKSTRPLSNGREIPVWQAHPSLPGI